MVYTIGKDTLTIMGILTKHLIRRYSALISYKNTLKSDFNDKNHQKPLKMIKIRGISWGFWGIYGYIW